MASLQSIIIPGIVIGLIGGITMFIAAYSYYPEKHLNVNIDGKCFEFLGSAFQDYKNLEFDNEILTKMLQIHAIGNRGNIVPVSYIGSDLQVNDFIRTYPIDITEYYKQKGSDLVADKIVIKGNMKNYDIVNYLKEISKTKDKTNSRNSLYNFGILPNKYITSLEGIEISKTADKFMGSGLKSISIKDNDVNNAECRTNIVYDNKI